jgi:Terminase large subunit, T4likevirus-type, N-terminal
MLDRALAYALDAAALMRAAGLTPDPWQERLLRSPSKRALVLACRQAGKSSVAAIRGLHTALFTPEALVLLVSPSLRQSSEVFRKVLDAYRSVADLVGMRAESALRAEFENGSRVISLPGTETTTRGYSGVSLLVLDEAARISDELLAAVRPALATSGGALLALSTAWTRTGWFFEAWTGAEEWERIKVPATECPRISEGFLREERAALGQLAFEAEYLCAFVDETGSFFASDAIRAAVSYDLEPLCLS